jgi:hypothetical protein
VDVAAAKRFSEELAMTIRRMFSVGETGRFWKRELPNNYL